MILPVQFLGSTIGFRSGTLNVPGIVGLGIAAQLAHKEMKEDAAFIGRLRNELETSLLIIPGTKVNGNKEMRLYNVTNILFEECDSDALIMALGDIAVSNGSACTAALVEPSHVLIALGLDEKLAFSSLRFSLGKFNNQTEIHSAINAVERIVQNFKATS